LSRNPPLAITMPLFKELPNDPDSSSEESLFSFPNEQQPLIRDPTEASGVIATTPPRSLTPKRLILPEIQ